MSSDLFFPIELPVIPTGNVYHFTTGRGTRYEVRFGGMESDPLSANIVFGVTNEEFEGEEYAVTNAGELYKVMATISEIIRIFVQMHPWISQYEFSGEPNKETEDSEPTVRTRFFIRYIGPIFGPSWNYEAKGNSVVIRRS